MSSKLKCLKDPKLLKQIEVLIVQSNPADTLFTMEAFKSAGLTSGLHCVSEGDDAMTYVLRRGKYAKVPIPDLVFLDLSQPRASGLNVLRVIKSTPELMHIPIVVAAGSDDPNFIRAVYALNGNCFIRKPGELTEFLRFIETCYEFWGSVVTLSPVVTLSAKATRSRAAGTRAKEFSSSQAPTDAAGSGPEFLIPSKHFHLRNKGK